MFAKSVKFLFLAFGLLVSFAANAATVDNLLNHAGNPVGGNPNGKITVVEFFDYQCSHCANMASTIVNIVKANPDVRIVFKDFPIRGPMSDFAAKAAIAANKQGKYVALNHALLTTGLSLTDENIYNIAKEQGINVTQLKKDINSSSVASQLKSNQSLASELNINGTPAFFIGKSNAKSTSDLNFVLGEMSQSELQDAINKAKS